VAGAREAALRPRLAERGSGRDSGAQADLARAAGSNPPRLPLALPLCSAERLLAKHGALPVWRSAARRAARHLRRLADLGEVASDALGLGDHGEQLHAAVAGRAIEDIERERAGCHSA
jgi:hypothetical protein